MADEVVVQPASTGARLRLRVKPGARSSQVIGAHGGALKLQVQAAPEKGRANLAVIDLLAALLGVAGDELELTAGAASQDKSMLVYLDAPDVVRRLRAAGVPARIAGPADPAGALR